MSAKSTIYQEWCNMNHNIKEWKWLGFAKTIITSSALLSLSSTKIFIILILIIALGFYKQYCNLRIAELKYHNK